MLADCTFVEETMKESFDSTSKQKPMNPRNQTDTVQLMHMTDSLP